MYTSRETLTAEEEQLAIYPPRVNTTAPGSVTLRTFDVGGDKFTAWGVAGAFWGGIWGLWLAPAVFILPGFGVVAMAGPVAAALVGALEGAVLVGGVSALGAALSQVGVPKDQVIKYETALKVDKYILLVHGNAEDLTRARTVLAGSKALLTA